MAMSAQVTGAPATAGTGNRPVARRTPWLPSRMQSTHW